MKALLLRFDAPLVSFGAPMIDQNGVVQTFPGLSMLTGLLSNALGWDHRDADRLESLQDRIRYAARVDRRGETLIDYQTVDLGKDWMLPDKAGWTTKGMIADRGGASGDATHQRYRHYRADSVHTVVLSVEGDGNPSLDDLARALEEPARPLFIGRKCCLPASPILIGQVEGRSLRSALVAAPQSNRADDGALLATWFDADEPDDMAHTSHIVAVTDERDWRSQVHTGRRFMREGLVTVDGHRG